MRVLNEKHNEMGGIARLKVRKVKVVEISYFFPSDMSPRNAAVTKIRPDPMIVVYDAQRQMEGMDILQKK